MILSIHSLPTKPNISAANSKFSLEKFLKLYFYSQSLLTIYNQFLLNGLEAMRKPANDDVPVITMPQTMSTKETVKDQPFKVAIFVMSYVA